MHEPTLIKQLRAATKALRASYRNRLIKEVTEGFKLEEFHKHFYWGLKAIYAYSKTYSLVVCATRNIYGEKLKDFLVTGCENCDSLDAQTEYLNRRESIRDALSQIYGTCRDIHSKDGTLRFSFNPTSAANLLSKEEARWDPEFDLEAVLTPLREHVESEKAAIAEHEAALNSVTTAFYNEVRAK